MNRNVFYIGLAAIAAAALVAAILFMRSSETKPMPQSNPSSAPDKKMPRVSLETDKGVILIELYPAAAPETIKNFLSLVNSGFYDGTKFHRVISNFMIQGGDPLSRTDDPRVGTGGPGYQFKDEINPRALGLSAEAIQALESAGYEYDYSLPSRRVDVGAIAMANSGPNTNGSQFFIVTESPQPHLDGRHTVFGKVIEGMDAARAIVTGDALIRAKAVE